MTIEEDIAEKVRTVKTKNGGPKSSPPIPMPGPSSEEIEAGLMAWRRTQAENESLKLELARIRSEKDELRGVLRSLASILVSYHQSLSE